MIFLSILQTTFLKKIIIPLFALSFILLALVPIVGVEVKGAKRWLDFYFFRLQPIEVLKPFFILATVKILTLEKFKNSQVKYILSFFLLSAVIILLIDQPDLGQSILLLGSLGCYSVYLRSKLTLYFWFFFNIFDFNKLFIISHAWKIWIRNK